MGGEGAFPIQKKISNFFGITIRRVISNLKILFQIFWHLNKFLKKNCNIFLFFFLSKKGRLGGGAKAVWEFSDNSSIS